MAKQEGDSKPNVVKDKSLAFAVRVVKLARWLKAKKRESILGTQLLRSGTAIGALVREAEHAESRKDFLHKMTVALKEANESDYWILLLHECELITDAGYKSIRADAQELVRLLASIVKTTKRNRPG